MKDTCFMKGFTGIIFLLLLLAFVSVGLYYLMLGYQRFEGSKYAVDSLSPIHSDFHFFDTYVMQNPTSIQPGIMFDEDKNVVYKSSFPPCMTLIEDRTWTIYASQNNVFPTYLSKMYFDRFWRIGWLGLIPKDSGENATFTFYGPFRYTDLPTRNYLEYLLIGKDVVQSGLTLEVSAESNDCAQTPLSNVKKTFRV